MTIEEVNHFYKQDKKQYIIKYNQDFQNWCQFQKNTYQYTPEIELSEIDSLIQNITTWYEFKYPDYILILHQEEHPELPYIKVISKELDFEQLKLRLSKSGRQVLNAKYRSNSLLLQEKKTYIGIDIFQEELGTFTISVDEFGMVEKYHLQELKEFLPPQKGSIHLKRILLEFKKNPPQNLDVSEIENCIRRHELDLELRDKIIGLSALSLLYSKKTIPEYGYFRAITLLKEYNNYYQRNLSTEIVEEVIFKKITSKKRILIYGKNRND